jgi:hypothetical protein
VRECGREVREKVPFTQARDALSASSTLEADMWKKQVTRRRAWLGATSLAVALSTGCGSPPPAPEPEAPEAILPVKLGDTFVAVPRAVDAKQRQQVEQRLAGVVDDSEKSFYLAIRRGELGQKWFLSAYLKQNHPGGVLYGAASSLGTRVVSFKEQNGKLFVLDVDDRKVLSDVFDPEVLVEAYPIVTDHGPFNRLRGSEDYVLIDPTAGLNRFGVMGDLFSAYRLRYQVELSFAQRFRVLKDGVSFDQVFTGYLETPDDFAHYFLEPNPFRDSGTLSIALRRYAESPGYTPTPLPATPHFFAGPPRLIPNTGAATEQVAAKWAIHPGMKPIQWHITPSILQLQSDPRYQGYDLVGAVKRGIEGWNSAFGFQALEAQVADGSVSFGDDDKNVFIFDTDEGMPFAFANWRTNPNTSEVRGASVYFSAIFLAGADADYGDDATVSPEPRQPSALRPAWAGMRASTLCEWDVARLRRELEGTQPLTGEPLTQKQKVERFLTQVTLHEIGHTLGLRHNFAGSRVYDGNPSSPRSSSVMDYATAEDAIYLDTPGPYDVAAVRYLYGLSSQLPTQPFCTDDARRTDPYCAPDDRFDEPLTKWHIPVFHNVLQRMLASASNYSRLRGSFDYYGNTALGFVRAGSSQSQATAYTLALAPVRPPLVVPAGAPSGYATRADELARRILTRLYLDPESSRGLFTSNPPNSAALLPLVVADVKAILLNTDGIRGYPSRRAMVDVLKAQQTLAAYSALREARDTLTAQLPSLGEDDRLQTEDLLSRISAALSPYYR